MILELENVEVRYGAVPAVRGLSLQLAEREIVGLIGPNGAGKSTTLHAIMGLCPVHAGQAPCGELKLKLRGAGSSKEPPCSGQA